MVQNLETKFSPISDHFSKNIRSAIASPVTSRELVNDHKQDAFYFRELEEAGVLLNEQQIQAVRACEGPVIINAGAGSGKTTVIIARAGYLLKVKKVPANSIMLVTFTTKAAQELKERIRKLPGIKTSEIDQMSIGTFHSIFLRMLRENGVDRQVLHGERRVHILMKQIMRKLRMADAYDPEILISLISHYKNNLHTPDMLERKTDIQQEIHAIFSAYEEWKDEENYMDFDDFLLFCWQMLSFKSAVLERYQSQYRYFILDESQDTSPVQYEIMKLLASAVESPNFCMVGDDSQCLYGFRSAKPEFMLNFKSEYRDSRVINLEINYRSTDSIVGLGNAILKDNKKRLDKTLKSIRPDQNEPLYGRPENEDAEADQLVRVIQKNVQAGAAYSDHTVLYRSHANNRAIVDELVMTGIPFIVHGKQNSFYEDARVKPIVDMIRLSLEPSNEDAILGAATILYMKKDHVMKSLENRRAKSLYTDSLTDSKMKWVFDELTAGKPDFQRRQLQTKEMEIRQLHKMKPLEAIKTVRKGAVAYDKMLETDEKMTLTLHKEMVIETLDTLEQSASRFNSAADFIRFVDNVVEKGRRMEEIKKIPNYNAVHLMTVHASKGLEFKNVFLIGAVDGIMPHKAAFKADNHSDRVAENSKGNAVEDALEEENRIFYVGVSRAENNLYISSPLSYLGKQRDVSRFLINAFKEASSPEKVALISK